MPSPYHFVSPPRRRQRGGVRVGAGRKRKETPKKKENRISAQFRRRRRIRAQWLKLQTRLIKYTKSGNFGPEYLADQRLYVQLGQLLGVKTDQFETLSDPSEADCTGDNSDSLSESEDTGDTSSDSESNSGQSTGLVESEVNV